MLSALSDPPPTGLRHMSLLFLSVRSPAIRKGMAPSAAHPGTDKDEVLALCPVFLLLEYDAQLVLDTLRLNELAN